ncbi:MAG: methyltransferase domain-containing protein [Fibrobacter sp.]|jgi:malonyl-CoA O-methyltransferase|nr:methyltransferase domain-containing protein [Fibrobacter sp.]
MNLPPSLPTKKKIAAAFSSKAGTYNQFASVQKELLQSVRNRIIKCQLAEMWVDLGCGTGILEEMLLDKDQNFHITGVDLSRNSLSILTGKKIPGIFPVQADIEKLPLKKGCFTGAIVCSVLQWLDTSIPVLKGISGLLTRNGKLVFSVFTDGCFKELTEIRRHFGLSVPVRLSSPDNFSEQLRESGFTLLEYEIYHCVKYFPSAMDLLRSLSSTGSTAVNGRRMSRSELQRFCRYYEDIFSTPHGIPLTYQAMIGTSVKKEQT